MNVKTKIFKTERTRTAPLRRKFRSKNTEDHIQRDPETEDVVPLRGPDSWNELFAIGSLSVVPANFMSAEDRQQDTHDRDPFADLAS